MNVLKSILIKYIVDLDNDAKLRELFIVANTFAGGLTDRDALDPKEEMIYETTKVLDQLYYEDVEFFHNFVTGYAQKKGVKV